jgi:hypothetical protein
MIKRILLVLALAGAVSARAGDSFTQGIAPADFQAAGLGKLTPDELAKLDALVLARQAGAAQKAAEDTRKAVTETVRAEERAAARKEASSSGFLDRMKVVLKPGTEIDYTTLDAMLPAGYSGWSKGQVLTLTNGQRWLVTDSGGDYEPPTGKPVHVRIVPGAMGSFFMEVEGGTRVRVRFYGNAPEAAGAPSAGR